MHHLCNFKNIDAWTWTTHREFHSIVWGRTQALVLLKICLGSSIVQPRTTRNWNEPFCSAWASITSINWELYRNAESQAPSQIYWVRIFIFNKTLGDLYAYKSLRSIALDIDFHFVCKAIRNREVKSFACSWCSKLGEGWGKKPGVRRLNLELLLFATYGPQHKGLSIFVSDWNLDANRKKNICMD